MGEARWHGAHLLARVLGPPEKAYLGPLLTHTEAVELARDAQPVALSIGGVAALFTDPETAAGAWFHGDRWQVTTTLAAARVGDDGVLLVWDGGAFLDLYDRATVLLVQSFDRAGPASGRFPEFNRFTPTLAHAAPYRSARGQPHHALWLRRRWLHEPRTDAEVRTLVARLHAHDIDTIYPFVGPMRPGGRFGWRDGDTLREYDRATAKAFFARARAAAEADGSKLGLRILPWTGGVLHRDVHLADPRWRADFVEEARALVELGADGVQLNIEPMPSFEPGYLELLAELRAGLGPDAILGVAAYPPPTPLHPYADLHWTLPFLAEVCRAADDVAVMAYDTSLTTEEAYATLMTDWTDALGATFPERSAPGGCAWRMGVPTYEDEEAWHHPDAETLRAAIDGIAAATAERRHDGLAIYASWTTGAADWATFDLRVREFGPMDVNAIDPR